MKSWINERCSPDILPYDNLVNDLLEQLEVQVMNSFIIIIKFNYKNYNY